MFGYKEQTRKNVWVFKKFYFKNCEGNGHNVPGHSKHTQMCLACKAEKWKGKIILNWIDVKFVQKTQQKMLKAQNPFDGFRITILYL